MEHRARGPKRMPPAVLGLSEIALSTLLPLTLDMQRPTTQPWASARARRRDRGDEVGCGVMDGSCCSTGSKEGETGGHGEEQRRREQAWGRAEREEPTKSKSGQMGLPGATAYIKLHTAMDTIVEAGTMCCKHLPANSSLALLPKSESIKMFNSHVEIGLRNHKVFEELLLEKEAPSKTVSIKYSTTKGKGRCSHY
ncbi:hypothetical protein B0H11DRAFT_1936824 [Mycena galericulata]|nr:hypothetical protein B0H11DRAFT_1936824 [Mycena galericulata]